MKRLSWIPLLIVACSSGPESADPPRYTLEAVSGGNQEAAVTESLPAPLVFRLRDQYGESLSGERVLFALSEGGGQFAPEETFTDGDGRVSSILTLGTVAGRIVIEPELPDLENLDAVETLAATALPGEPVALAWVLGDGQKDAPGAELQVPLRIEAQDSYGNAVEGIAVELSSSDDSRVLPDELITGSGDGLWTLGEAYGPYQLAASSAGLAGATALAEADHPPTVSSFTSTADEGNPVHLTGENFCTTPVHNTLTLGGLPMEVTAASETSLTGIVPVGLTLGEHPMTLSVGSQDADQAMTVEVSLSLGRVRDFPFVDGEVTIPVSAFSPTSEYVAITYSLRDRAPYAVQPVLLEEAPAPLPFELGETTTADFHARLLKTRGSGAPGPMPETDRSRESRTFNVLADYFGSTTDPDAYDQIVANRVYEGAHVRIYLDERDAASLPSNRITELGQVFDSQIYFTDRNAFGNESDYDGNGRVMVLLTRVVNLLTGQIDDDPLWHGAYVGGFFNPVDLPIWSWPSGTSNQAEIFYGIVPDPTGQFSDVEHTIDSTLESLKPILAHEFQHMINFYQRHAVYGGGNSNTPQEDLWLNEGLSHLAENLCGFHEHNVDRVNLYLQSRLHRWIALASLEGTQADVGNALGERGASFLFTRYLADRWPGSPMDLVKSTVSGRDNVAQVTGQIFEQVYKDWLAALYLDGRAYADDPRYQFSSLDIRTDFPYEGGHEEPLSFFEIPLSDPVWSSAIVPTGFDLLELEGQAPGGVTQLRFSGDEGAEMGVLLIRTGL